MNSKHLISKTVPSAEELSFLEDRLYEFNSTQVKRDDGQLFAFLIRNEHKEILAGISGWTWAHACEIQTLWVHPSWRRQEYGRSLLESAEDEARSSWTQCYPDQQLQLPGARILSRAGV